MAPRDGTEFAVLAMSIIPDLSFFTYTAQFFPRYTYGTAEPADGTLDFSSTDDVDEWGYRRIDNITDEIHELYRSTLGHVTKDDIFYFVYGRLHSPTYRTRYASDLKKMLPRIPTPETRVEFDTYRDAGAALLTLHADYETVEPYAVDVQLKPDADPADRDTWRVSKMKWRSKTDHSGIVYNAKVTIAGVPASAEDYLLGSRTALGWIIDRYQVKTDKASGIVNDPNDWCDEHGEPKYIVDLIAKVTTVAVETVRIVDGLREFERQ